MPCGRKTALTITLTADERQTLLAWQRSTTIRAGRARRGRIILQLADGVPISHIATTVGLSRRFIYKWAWRFQEHGIEGLADKPGRGTRRRLRQHETLKDQHDVTRLTSRRDLSAYACNVVPRK